MQSVTHFALTIKAVASSAVAELLRAFQYAYSHTSPSAACELLVVVVVKAFSWRRKKHASRERYRVETVICGSERGSKG